MSRDSLAERGANKAITWILEALIIIGVLTIPVVFKVKGDLWGRFVVALWVLIIVSVLATIMVKSMGFAWRRRKKE